MNAKPAGLLAAKRALGEHAAHLDHGAAAVEGLLPGTFRLRRSLVHEPPATLVVLTADPLVEVDGRGRLRLLANFMRSVVEKSTYPAYRILVVDDDDETGPFDEALARDYNDVDFCLRARRAGYRIVYTPFAELFHFEGATLRRSSQHPNEVTLFRERWRTVLDEDPYYNPNLPRDRADYAV